MLKKLYDKSKIWFAVMWIVSYCVLMSVGDSLSVMLGVEKSVTFAVGLALSFVLLLFLKKNGMFEYYGLCCPKVSAKTMLYYIPVLVMLTTNCWYGLTFNFGVLETVLYILAMLCVGFLEEVIFRGLLFEAMRKENVKSAIIISSVTFGIGHIINLVNGSGAEILPNLLQVIYATAAGFMFVMMYYKTKSLIICIAAHGIFNALSVFANEANTTQNMRILTAIALTVLTGGYATYIALTLRKNAK
ncbi:MAG: CPBP family intramembrane metalloprotease [Ruminococcaceae bacterium]|nr:CPBP family intramembrane metalloprotease [Oscillospiraceae bacterium]